MKLRTVFARSANTVRNRKGQSMKTTLLRDLTVADICEGFVYNELEGKGLFG